MSLRIRIVAASGKLFLALGLSLGLTGTAFAGYLGGLEAYKRGEYETALEEWSVAARLGDFRAQFGVGILYLYGRGAERDPIGTGLPGCALCVGSHAPRRHRSNPEFCRSGAPL